MKLERVTPESVGIHSKGILDFIESAERRGLELHGMMLLRHGKVCAEGWWKPYNPDSPHMMFSFTKALTSTAIGFACAEGKLALTDRLADIFPEEMPENPSENLLLCTVRDLLTMTCGHETEIEWSDGDRGGTDWVRRFLAHEFKYKPGTCFMYNTAGTNLLCAALKKRTGEDLIAYLRPRLLDPLGIGEVHCFALPDGTEMGGAGSRLRVEDMARFIQFAANGGVWEGKRLLPAAWFEMATAKQVETVSPAYQPGENLDWTAGYGFQFWRCVPPNVCRADGAFGQYGVIFEDKDTVLILQSASLNQQEQLLCAWESLLPAITDEETLPESPMAHVLKHRLEKAEMTPMLSAHNKACALKFHGKKYTPEAEMPGLADFIGGVWVAVPDGGKTRSLRLEFAQDKAVLIAEQDNGTFSVDIGMESHFALSTLCGRTYGGVGRWRGDDRFEAEIRCAESIAGKRLIFNFAEDALEIDAELTLPSSEILCGSPRTITKLKA